MKKLRNKGFTLVEIMIVVAIIGLLAAIAIPNFMKARETAQKNACIANLKQIEGAMEIWAIDTNANTGDAVTLATLVPDYIARTPACPADGTYTVTAVGTAPTCSIAGHELP